MLFRSKALDLERLLGQPLPLDRSSRRITARLSAHQISLTVAQRLQMRSILIRHQPLQTVFLLHLVIKLRLLMLVFMKLLMNWHLLTAQEPIQP